MSTGKTLSGSSPRTKQLRESVDSDVVGLEAIVVEVRAIVTKANMTSSRTRAVSSTVKILE